MDYLCTQTSEIEICRQAEEIERQREIKERNRVHEETMQMLREMIKIQEEKRIYEEAARQEEEKRIAKEKEAAELEAKHKIQECLNIKEKSIPQASTRSRKFRIDPTLRNFTISTKRIPFSTVETVNSLKIGDKHLDTQKGSLESSVKDPIPIPSESDVISDGDCDDYQKWFFTPICSAIRRPAINASYSASLFVPSNVNLMAYVNSAPSRLVSISPAPELSIQDDSFVKRVQGSVLGLYWISYPSSSNFHFSILPEISELDSSCFIG
ncbi:hypothetical protein Tco_0767793 [Tanacetum coccineum]